MIENKTCRRLILALGLALYVMGVYGQKGLKFRPISETEAELYNGRSAKGEVVVPEYVTIDNKQYRVTKIGKYSFDYSQKMTGIVLPPSVEEIGMSAFTVRMLKKVSLPASLKTIGYDAFGCSGVNFLELPEGVVHVDQIFRPQWGEGSILNIPSTCKFLGNMPLCIDEAEIPNTVDTITFSAFYNSRSYSVKELILPDNVKLVNIVEWKDQLPVYGLNPQNRNLFHSFKNLKVVRGHHVKYPAGFLEVLDYVSPEIPFHNEIAKIKSGFSYFAYQRVPKQMEEWQQKGELEKTADWRLRMSDENRRAQMRKLMDEARTAYIESRKPSVNGYRLGTYHADEEMFPLIVNNIDTVYLKVARTKAPQFKQDFRGENVVAEFGIKDDQVTLVSCEYKTPERIYASLRLKEDDFMSDMAFNMPALNVDLTGGGGSAVSSTSATAMSTTRQDRTLDENIPETGADNSKTFAVLIGNENYQQVSSVPFARNDAKTVAAYCRKTLGLPERNIRLYEDASYGKMLAAIQDLKDIAQAYQGDIRVIFYYAGHGIPNETTKDAYLLPVDADGRQTEACYATDRLYQELGSLGARSVTVLLDACFSGAVRGNGMLVAARGVALKPKEMKPVGNMVVFSAASGDQTAFPYEEKGHGMFTYYLLKKLQESRGDVTLGELGDYVKTQVAQQSIIVNGKSQTPTIHTSVDLSETWKTNRLK